MMRIKYSFLVLLLATAGCQNGVHFGKSGVEEPDWFVQKTTEAKAKPFPATRAVPPAPPKGASLDEQTEALRALTEAGEEVRNVAQKLTAQERQNTDEFARESRELAVVPPPVPEDQRPE